LYTIKASDTMMAAIGKPGTTSESRFEAIPDIEQLSAN